MLAQPNKNKACSWPNHAKEHDSALEAGFKQERALYDG